MVESEGGGEAHRARRWRSVAEKRRIAELTFEPGASVALVARAHGVNAHLVFKWRRELKRGKLAEPDAASAALLPVTLSAPCETANETREPGPKERSTASGAIHIEFLGPVMISVECGADPVPLRSILES